MGDVGSAAALSGMGSIFYIRILHEGHTPAAEAAAAQTGLMVLRQAGCGQVWAARVVVIMWDGGIVACMLY